MCPQYTDAPAPTPRSAQGLDIGKCRTKFQLSSQKGIKVISCKRNADVNCKFAPKLAGKLEPGYERDIRTYARTHVRT